MSWEYKTIKLEAKGILGGKMDVEEVDSKLNEQGRGGWELVTVFDTNMGHGRTRDVIAIFKRSR